MWTGQAWKEELTHLKNRIETPDFSWQMFQNWIHGSNCSGLSKFQAEFCICKAKKFQLKNHSSLLLLLESYFLPQKRLSIIFSSWPRVKTENSVDICEKKPGQLSFGQLRISQLKAFWHPFVRPFSQTRGQKRILTLFPNHPRDTQALFLTHHSLVCRLCDTDRYAFKVAKLYLPCEIWNVSGHKSESSHL